MAAVLIGYLLMTQPAIAGHDKSDIVTTEDGSTFIGEIRSVQFTSLTLKTHSADTLNIDWIYITSLVSKFEYRVQLSGGVRYFGTLEPPTKPRQLNIATSSGPVEVKFADIFEIVPIEHNFWQRLDGSVNFGFSYTQANSSLQYNLSGDASYRTRKNFAALSAQSIFNSQDGGEKTNQHYAQLLLAQAARKKWGAFELGQVQANPDQGYDLRVVAGGGATNFLLENAKRFVQLNLGAVFNREYVTDSSDVDNSAEALVGISLRRFKRSSHSPSIHLGLQTFTSLTESSRYRALFNFKISWKIIGDFQFNFQVTDHYDSKPPGDDASNNDMSVITSVGYKF